MDYEIVKIRSYRLTRGAFSLRASEPLDEDDEPVGPIEYCLYIYESAVPECSGFARTFEELEAVSIGSAREVIKRLIEDGLPFLMGGNNG